MNPRYSTTDRRVKRSLVGSARSTREANRLELSDTRGVQVYRDDVEFAPHDQGNRCRTRVPLTPAQVTDIRDRRHTGQTPEDIARQLKVHLGDVRRICAKVDIQLACEE